MTLGWSYSNFDAVIFENSQIRVTVLPEVGAKIHEMIDKRIDQDLLFHHPRVEVRKPVFGANVDNWWSGGIDDAFPTGQPSVVNGEELPFLGEVWSMPWTAEQLSPFSVKFSRKGVITPFLMERTMTLNPGASFLEVDYRITNIGTAPFPYIWGIHPTFPIGDETKLHIPAKKIWYVDGTGPQGSAPEFLAGKEPMDWPMDSLAKLSDKDPLSWEYYYLSQISAGWLAVTNSHNDSGFAMSYDVKTFPNIHVWMVNGGWRGIRTVAVEPWTAMPSALDQAITAGTAGTLQPHESVASSVRFIAFKPQETINGFDQNGQPQ